MTKDDDGDDSNERKMRAMWFFASLRKQTMTNVRIFVLGSANKEYVFIWLALTNGLNDFDDDVTFDECG